MSGTHGDLFREIGSLVVAAHAGQTIDLTAKSEEMAERYRSLGLPAETLAKAIARSLGAISVSLELVPPHGGENGRAHPADVKGEPILLDDGAPAAAIDSDGPARKASRLFPSGVKLGLLS